MSVLLQRQLRADHVEVHFNSRDIESAVQAGAAAYTGVSVAFVSGGGDDDDWFIGILVYWEVMNISLGRHLLKIVKKAIKAMRFYKGASKKPMMMIINFFTQESYNNPQRLSFQIHGQDGPHSYRWL